MAFKLEPYDEDTGYGLLRHCLIRTGKVSKETMVVLVLTNKNFKGKNNFVKAFKNSLPEVKTLVFNENPRKTNVILGNFESVEYGPGFIYDFLLGVKFKISSKSFYQINHDQCEVLYSKAISFASIIASLTISTP